MSFVVTVGQHMIPGFCATVPFFRSAVYPPANHFLLGQEGYPCIDKLINIITPYRKPIQGPIRARFNSFIQGRGALETTLGKIRTRWRAIILQILSLNQLIVPKVVIACAMLHNICFRVGDIMHEAVIETTRRYIVKIIYIYI